MVYYPFDDENSGAILVTKSFYSLGSSTPSIIQNRKTPGKIF
jgi:hypothetical protein